jgi:hypothetical protein
VAGCPPAGKRMRERASHRRHPERSRVAAEPRDLRFAGSGRTFGCPILVGDGCPVQANLERGPPVFDARELTSLRGAHHRVLPRLIPYRSPHALGPQALPEHRRPALHHVQLLPPSAIARKPPCLCFVRVGAGAGAPQLWIRGHRLRPHAGTCSLADERDRPRKCRHSSKSHEAIRSTPAGRPSGNSVITTSTFGPRRSASRSFATCTAIQLSAAWWRRPEDSEVEQLPQLRHRRGRCRRDRIAVDRPQARAYGDHSQGPDE